MKVEFMLLMWSPSLNASKHSHWSESLWPHADYQMTLTSGPAKDLQGEKIKDTNSYLTQEEEH